MSCNVLCNETAHSPIFILFFSQLCDIYKEEKNNVYYILIPGLKGFFRAAGVNVI
jgi:hypothetical protein